MNGIVPQHHLNNLCFLLSSEQCHGHLLQVSFQFCESTTSQLRSCNVGHNLNKDNIVFTVVYINLITVCLHVQIQHVNVLVPCQFSHWNVQINNATHDQETSDYTLRPSSCIESPQSTMVALISLVFSVLGCLCLCPWICPCPPFPLVHSLWSHSCLSCSTVCLK